MNHLLDDEDDMTPKHRELTFSSGAIFAMFFGLVLSWGLFFALGFNLGSHKATAPEKSDNSDSSSAPTANFSSFKPAAGSPAGGASTLRPAASESNNASLSVPPASSSSPANSPAATPANTEEPEPVHATPVAMNRTAPAPAPAPPQPAVATPASTATGNFIVQVAAVSHQEDADLLVTALKAKGYAVAARSEPQDKLVHIQVGPFNNRAAADAMRQRLLGDGYNAIIK
jgi:DedD protein